MLKTYTYPQFPYHASAEQRSGHVKRHAVVVIGAGPIGLTMALDLAARGLDVVVLDDNNTVSIGSRAVCYAKRPLEVWDRLGVAASMCPSFDSAVTAPLFTSMRKSLCLPRSSAVTNKLLPSGLQVIWSTLRSQPGTSGVTAPVLRSRSCSSKRSASNPGRFIAL